MALLTLSTLARAFRRLIRLPVGSVINSLVLTLDIRSVGSIYYRKEGSNCLFLYLSDENHLPTVALTMVSIGQGRCPINLTKVVQHLICSQLPIIVETFCKVTLPYMSGLACLYSSNCADQIFHEIQWTQLVLDKCAHCSTVAIWLEIQ